MSTAETERWPNLRSGTAQGLNEFLGYVIEQNYMNSSTASALRTATSKVLEAEPEPDALDIRHADLDDILHRFHFRNNGKMQDKSVKVYESRFNTSIIMYRKWLDNDKDWLPASARARRSSNNGTSTSKRSDTSKARQDSLARP